MNSAHIVIVEDDKWLSESFTRTLERNKYTVSVVDDSEAAIDVIDRIMPNLIVLDFFVRGGDVVALLHELRSHSDLAKIPIVMVSSHANRLDSRTMRSYGVIELLDKTTMHPEDLVACLKRAGI